MNVPHANGPVSVSERIQSLDVLRGFAVLGILIMNIQSFSMIGAAYLNPYAYGDMSGANRLVWVISHIIADRKFMTVFSMLFGAGVLLMTMRRESKGRPATWLHMRRMVLLLGFGVLHGFLLWYGDILHAYAVCGVLVFFMRKRSPKTLLITGTLVVGIASALTMFWQVTIPYWPDGTLADVEQTWWKPSEEIVSEQLTAYRGGWTEQQSMRAGSTLYMQTEHLLSETLWRAGGLMLIGMALFKLGLFSAALSRKTYWWILGLGVFVGLPGVLYGLHFRDASGWDITSAFFLGDQFNYWASIPVALAWIAVVMLLCKSSRLEALTQRLASVGQMALTAYLLQTILCTAIFYGHGLGLFGHVDRVGQVGIMIGIWVLLLIGCPIWMRHFRFGPFEWLWRSLTYMKVQGMGIVKENNAEI
ncbi:MAG: DUF418 domain-containing protein [bacterium]|nr:DUF418 domain-containing protein [bacterium]